MFISNYLSSLPSFSAPLQYIVDGGIFSKLEFALAILPIAKLLLVAPVEGWGERGQIASGP